MSYEHNVNDITTRLNRVCERLDVLSGEWSGDTFLSERGRLYVCLCDMFLLWRSVRVLHNRARKFFLPFNFDPSLNWMQTIHRCAGSIETIEHKIKSTTTMGDTSLKSDIEYNAVMNDDDNQYLLSVSTMMADKTENMVGDIRSLTDDTIAYIQKMASDKRERTDDDIYQGFLAEKDRHRIIYWGDDKKPTKQASAASTTKKGEQRLITKLENINNRSKGRRQPVDKDVIQTELKDVFEQYNTSKLGAKRMEADDEQEFALSLDGIDFTDEELKDYFLAEFKQDYLQGLLARLNATASATGKNEPSVEFSPSIMLKSVLKEVTPFTSVLEEKYMGIWNGIWEIVVDGMHLDIMTGAKKPNEPSTRKLHGIIGMLKEQGIFGKITDTKLSSCLGKKEKSGDRPNFSMRTRMFSEPSQRRIERTMVKVADLIKQVDE